MWISWWSKEAQAQDKKASELNKEKNGYVHV